MIARLAAWLICLAVLATPGLAAAQPYDAGHAKVELIAERDVAVPGETIYLALDKTIDEGWHVYWRNAGDAGLPPQIFWDVSPLGDVTEDSDFIWPLPKLLPVVEGEIMDYGYDDQLTLPFQLTVPEDAVGPITLNGIADYLICKDVCIPETAPVSLTLDVSPEQVPNTGHAMKIADALMSAPRPFDGDAVVITRGETLELSLAPILDGLLDDAELRFFPYGAEIIHAADQTVSRGEAGAALRLTANPRNAVGEALNGVIKLTEAGGRETGYIVSATPADAPLAGTLGAGGFAAVGVAGGASGVAPALGLLAILGFALLGGLVLNLMPCVLPVLSIKAMGMVQSASKGNAGELRAHGIAYTLGVLAAFAALAAAFVILRGFGEFWALGSLLQYPIVVAGLALGAFLLGLWLFGVFELGTSVQNVGSSAAGRGGTAGAFATGLLAATAGAPCVGPFMGVALGATLERPAFEVFVVYLILGLGLAAPFLILSFLPQLSRFLPKPGAWMERVKQFFAFPMFLTAAALLVVLGQQAGHGAVGWLVAGASLIAFGIWAMKSAGGSLRPAAMGIGALALIGGIALPLYTSATSGPAVAGTSNAYAATYETEAWSPQRVAELTAEGKGVFVDFTATWCIICQANKRTTLTRPEVLQAMDNANIAFLVADFTNKDPMIAEELQLRGRPGVPMYLLFAPGENQPKLLPQTLTPSLMLEEIAKASGNGA
ncbi:MAG: thioredoxin family protein [Pseudomonadota bacterium]